MPLTPGFPKGKIDEWMKPVNKFMKVEASGGIVLLGATILALFFANSQYSDEYLAIWKTTIGFKIGSFEMFHSLKHWISDGLMAIFFFVVGLEIKREVVHGQLGDVRRAILPVAAALGGMLVPVAIYLLLQGEDVGAKAWGVPMATDIAFVVGCLAVLGKRVPPILRIMLLSLAIVDDIGAILVIAIAFTDEVAVIPLVVAVIGLGLVYALQRIGVRNFLAYVLVGILVWIGFHESGIHATIAGVILGIMTPAKSHIPKTLFKDFLDRTYELLKGGEWEELSHRGAGIKRFQKATREVISPLEYLEDNLHPWTSFFIMPFFALANAGVVLNAEGFTDPVASSIAIALVAGKISGILIFSWIAVRLVLKKLPEGLDWWIMTGGASLAGIGFTMALFIAGLAVEGQLLANTKVGVIMGSIIAAAIGMTILTISLRSGKTEGNLS